MCGRATFALQPDAIPQAVRTALGRTTSSRGGGGGTPFPAASISFAVSVAADSPSAATNEPPPPLTAAAVIAPCDETAQLFALARSDGAPMTETSQSFCCTARRVAWSKRRPNCRAETVLQSHWCRDLTNRCVMLLDGFVEADTVSRSPLRRNRQHLFFVPTGASTGAVNEGARELLFVAAVCVPGDGGAVSVVTTRACDALAWCHSRQPLLLGGAAEVRKWLTATTHAEMYALVAPHEFRDSARPPADRATVSLTPRSSGGSSGVYCRLKHVELSGAAGDATRGRHAGFAVAPERRNRRLALCSSAATAACASPATAAAPVEVSDSSGGEDGDAALEIRLPCRKSKRGDLPVPIVVVDVQDT